MKFRGQQALIDTWGEHSRRARVSEIFRTIPTHVGRTGRQDSPRGPFSDHPHARGENASEKGVDFVLDGPSPRTWGELQEAVPAAAR